MTTTKCHTDIINQGWITRVSPSVRPYFYLMRLDRPIGTWLLLLPGWWAILWAFIITPSIPVTLVLQAVLLFAIGSIVMRGAGCIINDLWDRDLDKNVERTRDRPLASGQINIRQALLFLIVLMFAGLLILLQFNMTAIVAGVCSVLFIIIYPLMKRITWWPQAFLGLTFNFGALIGWAAITGEIGYQAWVLYIAGFFWTIGYDTIYAVQDMEDDALVGIKSTARLFDKNIRLWVGIFYAAFAVTLTVLFIVAHGASYHIAVLAAPFSHLVWQVRTLNISDPANALKRFRANRDFGLLLCAAIIVIAV